MKNSFGLFIMLALVSCAKARKMPPYEFQQNNWETSVFKNTLVINEYEGAMLRVEQNGGPGEMIIRDADATKLFNTLQIQATIMKGDDTFNEGKYKGGKYIYCMEQSRKIAPKSIYHTCFVALNVKSGKIKEIWVTPSEDKTIPHLANDYIGKNINIEAATGKIFIKLQEDDAKKLYKSLELDVATYETGWSKTGLDYGCHKTPIKKEALIAVQPAIEIKQPEADKPAEEKKTEEVVIAKEEVKITEENALPEVKVENVVPTEDTGTFAAYDPEVEDQVLPIEKDGLYNCNFFLKISDGGLFF